MSITFCFQTVEKKLVKADAPPPEGKKRKFRAGTVALKVFCVVPIGRPLILVDLGFNQIVHLRFNLMFI